MAVGSPGVPVQGQAWGWTGMVAAHDLSSAASAVKYVVALRVNLADVSYYPDYHGLVDQLLGTNADGRARLTIEAHHTGNPDCSGFLSQDVLAYQDGQATYPDGPVTMEVSLQDCGPQIDPGRITIDVQASADAELGDFHLQGDTGWIQTVFDVDVLSIAAVVD